MSVLSGVATAWCVLTALGWLGARAKAGREARSSPYRLRPDPTQELSSKGLVVVIPARNEAANIERCVTAVLADQDPRIRVVVVDDGSTDATPDILARLAAAHVRLQVVTSPDEPLPPGWLGKPRACQLGGDAAIVHAPDHLLFLDADVVVAPGGIRAAVAWLAAQRLDLVSVMGTLELQTFWERAVQPAVVGLILAGNDLSRVNDPEHRPDRPLANGQFMLFRAGMWRDLGGHAAVRDAIIDDVGLSTAVVRAGGAYQLLFGPRVFACRMYTGLGEIWSGWSKNLFEGMGASWATVGGLVGFIAASVVLPWVLVPVGLATGAPWLAGSALAAVAGMVAVRVQLDRRFGQDPRYALTIPLGWGMLAAIAVASGLQYRRGGGQWKGRRLPGVSGRALHVDRHAGEGEVDAEAVGDAADLGVDGGP